MSNDKSPVQRFILTGFTQQAGFRMFAFDGVSADRPRMQCTVRADLALIRGYDIRVQELPLLCRGLLERYPDNGAVLRLTFTEEDMRLHRSVCEAAQLEAARKRKPPRKPVGDHAGNGWRTTSPLSMRSHA